MKSVMYRTVAPYARFYQDHQWWVKLDDKSARHASEGFSVDMRPTSQVLVREEVSAPAARIQDDRPQMRKSSQSSRVLSETARVESMKRVLYHSVAAQDRFYQDHQWWVKVGDKSARHASQEITIDMSPALQVLVRGEESSPAGGSTYGRRQVGKREGFFLLLGTLIESIHWFQ